VGGWEEGTGDAVVEVEHVDVAVAVLGEVEEVEEHWRARSL